jgi:hypothetical protein
MMEFWLSKSSSHELFLFSRWYSGFQEAFLTNFFHDGILAIKEPFSRTFLFSRWYSGYQEAFLMNFFHDGILAIKEPFSQLFSRWNSGYQGAFLTNVSFFTMVFWLSGSLSHELFSRWNSGYQGAFLTNFFHDGILAIKEPFSRTFFTMEFWLSRSLSHCRMDLPGPTTSVGARTDYSVGPWDYPA